MEQATNESDVRTDDAVTAPESEPQAALWVERAPRAAAGAFAALLLVGFVLALRAGSDYWFWSDEWGLLAGRSLGDLDDLFRPQNQHLSAVPIVVYQVLYRVFGMDSYAPYQLAVLGLHLGLCTLLRTVMRRVGVSPWTATVVAGAFVFFGAGYQNILMGVQVSMVGTMVFGIGHLLMANHDGPFDRRDAIGLGLGLLGIAASGIGPVMVGVVGLAVLLRRGWLLALIHTVPLAVVFVGWRTYYDVALEASVGGGPNASTMASWVWHGELGVFMALGQWRIVAIALAVLLVVGLALALVPLGWRDALREGSIPLAMLAGGAALFAIVSTQRGFASVDFARSSRYVAMAAALTLPALAVAADAVIRRRQVLTPVVLVLFVVGVPANVALLDTRLFNLIDNEGFFTSQQAFVAKLVASEVLDAVPGEHQPDPHPFRTSHLDVDLLRDIRDNDRLSIDRQITPVQAGEAALFLSLERSTGERPPDATCVDEESLEVTVHAGEQVWVDARTRATVIHEGRPVGAPVAVGPGPGSAVSAVSEQVQLRLQPVGHAPVFTICR